MKAAIAAAESCLAQWDAAEPGGVLLLFDGDGLRHATARGRADLASGTALTPDTALRFASISKHVCAALAVAAGLDLDAPLGEALPELHPALGGVPIARAMGMTGGLPDLMDTAWLCGVPFTASLDRAALFDFACTLDALNSAPGEEMAYCNTGWRLLEHVLERRGLPFAAALRRQFFAPLDLGIRFPADEAEPVPGLAPGWWRAPDGWRRGRYGLHFSASGGLAGTPRDLARWLAALLAGRGPCAGLLAALAAPQAMADGTASFYGLGLSRHELGRETLIGHGGSLPGYKNHVLLAPSRGCGVLVMCNREDADPLGMALAVMAAWAGAELPTRPAALPQGLFAGDGPFWFEHRDGAGHFLGASEPLLAAGDAAVARSAYLPMTLRRDGDGIAGTIGHAARRFAPVPPDAALPANVEGRWRCSAQGAELEILQGALVQGGGLLRRRHALRPLGGDRALAARSHGPWMQRICLWWPERDRLRLVTHRSRVLEFHRV